MTRSRAQLAAAVATCALLAGCQSGKEGAPPGGRSAVGPLEAPLAHTWWRASNKGDVFSDGLEILRLQGDQAGVIDAVSVEGGDKSLEPLGARVGLPGRPDDFNQNMAGFPPTAVPAALQRPAVGATLVPGKSYLLILGYRVIANEVDRREAIVVDYTVDGTAYRATFPARLVVCPPPLTDTSCSEKHP